MTAAPGQVSPTEKDKFVRQLVSVIMPAYNAGKYIAQSIRSVAAQTCAGWELVVVDDGSTDDTAEVVRGFASADARVKYVQQANGRQGRARNNGIAHAAGDLIAFLDADDLWVERKLELQLKAFAETDADLVYGDGFLFDGEDVLDESRTFSPPAGRLEGAALFDLLLLHNPIPIQSVLLRRGVLERAGAFEEEAAYQNCEDYELWLRLAKGGAVFYGLEEKLIRYRRHPSAATHLGSRQLAPMIAVVKRYVGDSHLGERRVRQRVRELYRELLSALIREGKLQEARGCLDELRAWDGAGVVNSIQNLLLKLSPGAFDFVSRECLYRAEWHLDRVFGRLSSAHSLHP
jgi:teichuronic acid biosynthesis glycosyltransferase TuaG